MSSKLLIILTLTLGCLGAANAQDCAKVIDGGDGSMVFRNSKGDELVQMEGQKNSFSLFISGFELSFGANGENYSPLSSDDVNSKLKRTAPACKLSGRCTCGDCKCKPDAPSNRHYQALYAAMRYRVSPTDYLGTLDLGVNGFRSPDYSMYSDNYHGFLDLNRSKSINVTWNVIKISRNITRNGKLGYTAGLGLTWNNYVFDNNITLIKRPDGLIYPDPLHKDYKKTKLTTFSPRLTAVIGYKLGPLRIAGGVYGEYIARAYTKYKKPKHKNDKSMFNIHELQGGITARVGFRNIKVFANYQLTDYFKHNKGPETSMYTIGVTLF